MRFTIVLGLVFGKFKSMACSKLIIVVFHKQLHVSIVLCEWSVKIFQINGLIDNYRIRSSS